MRVRTGSVLYRTDPAYGPAQKQQAKAKQFAMKLDKITKTVWQILDLGSLTNEYATETKSTEKKKQDRRLKRRENSQKLSSTMRCRGTTLTKYS